MQIATRRTPEADPPVSGQDDPALERAPQPNVVEATARPVALPAPTVALPAPRMATWLRSALPRLAMTCLSLGLFIAFWYLVTKYKLDFYIRFINIPSPGEVLANASALMYSEKFYNNMYVSLRRILFGFGVATLLGVALGLLIGQYRGAKALLFPIFETMRPIPAIAWVPMAIMLWPSNETSIVFITFLGSFFPILLNTIHGVNSVDPVLVRAARCLGTSEFGLLRQVILPAALPHIFTGLAIGMGVAWVSLIAAEMISGQYGIGYFTWEAYALIEYADIVIGMIVIGLLGLLCSGGIRVLGNLLMPWMSNNAHGDRK